MADTATADMAVAGTATAGPAGADVAMAGRAVRERPNVAVRRPVPLHPRLCAGAAAASAAAHGWMAWLHRGNWWEFGLMVLMAAACLSCIVQLWRSGCVGAARRFMAMALAMAGFHLLLLVQPLAGGVQAHHTAVAATVQAASAGTGAGAGSAEPMLAVIFLELAGAMAAATWVRRSARQL
ncbi:hypothetical protein [Arthrobacter mangrovi]|uniref:Uncharacterized protein n=1 Tax=Arthrobacter mangrovi TaxID=2966350 RepID=A0ABQ5MS43_9MICC|nr:hypothetical protein [Arthrobacter mangrovi]GLB66766.1 hypothetical protein AHIS1636_12050 [Arthrobacter mangrovi]